MKLAIDIDMTTPAGTIAITGGVARGAGHRDAGERHVGHGAASAIAHDIARADARLSIEAFGDIDVTTRTSGIEGAG